VRVSSGEHSRRGDKRVWVRKVWAMFAKSIETQWALFGPNL